MKKIKNLLVILLVMMIAFPFNVKAETEKPEANKEQVKIYMFYGNGCQYCEAALEWFESIEEEYGDYFDLVKYEVWYDTENQELMEKVANFKGDTASGVPYILLGKYSYPNGFANDTQVSSDSEQTMGEQLIERVLEEYESDERYDVMVEINNQPDHSNIVGIVAVVVIAGLVVVAVISRRQND